MFNFKTFLLLLGSILFFHANSLQKPGAIILVGGGSIPDQAIKWMFERSTTNKFLVITSNPELSQRRWNKLLENVDYILPENLSLSKLLSLSGIIIDGGDQWEYLNRLDGKILQKAHENGITILGTSAGAMILGEYYFSAAEGTISSEEAIKGERLCLGGKYTNICYLKGMIIDTHFNERNRSGRLQKFIEKSGAFCGLGIDEGTAVCFDQNNFYITGNGKVSLMGVKP